MCGITGFLSSRDRTDDAHSLSRMTGALAHRGPDGDGHWLDEEAGVALGHRRLAIVDLSPTGRQPMTSASGRYVLTFNGEIYNFQALRRELEAHFHRFRGSSDTEVMLAAFETWGLPGALKRFVGMFAFALWDRHARVLYLGRDRLGEKPLYYTWMGGNFLFGSELKALRAHPAWQGEVDRDSIALLLCHNCIQAPATIYRGVHQLPPGSWLAVRPGAPAGAPTVYWDARELATEAARAPFRGSAAEAEAQLAALLDQAIAGQMMADVPLGAFLSGGIDSSLVVALMQARSSRPIKTFSIGFHEPEFDEAGHARAIAGHLGTDHTELYVSSQDALAVIPELPHLYDEPFADVSQIPTYLVAQLARAHVTVSLSGDGGDELFGGYSRYRRSAARWQNQAWLPAELRRFAGRSLSALGPDRWDRWLDTVSPGLGQARLGDRAHKLSALLADPVPEAFYYGLMRRFPDPGLFVRGATRPATPHTDAACWADLPTFVQRAMFLDLVTYLPSDILVKVDRAAMGVSLETRVPFLDHRVVEFSWRLPLALQLRGGEGKHLLRRVLDRHVPRALVDRPKQGFAVPIGSWLRGPLREWAETLLDPARLRQEGYLEPTAVRACWDDHLAGRRDDGHVLWHLLTFQAWLETQARADRAHAA